MRYIIIWEHANGAKLEAVSGKNKVVEIYGVLLELTHSES
jgi:hypothetical protein